MAGLWVLLVAAVTLHRNCPTPIIFCVLDCKHQIVYGISVSIFNACLRLRFLNVETNAGPLCPVLDVCRILWSNVRGLAGNLSDLTVASSQYNILWCSDTLVSDMRHMLEFLVPGFGRLVLLCQGKVPRAPGMVAYVRDSYGAFRQPKCECSCCEMQFLGFLV